MGKLPRASATRSAAAGQAALAALAGGDDATDQPADTPAVLIPPPPTSAPWRMLWRSPLNPRKRFDEASLEGLADSIGAEGIHIPLLVRLANQPGNTPVHGACDGDWEIIGGERRHRGVGLLIERNTLTTDELLPIKLLHPCDDRRFMEIVLTENLARRDMTPLEEARLFVALINAGGSTASIGTIAGIGQRAVQKRLKLLKDLTRTVLEALEDGSLGVEYANVLASLCPLDRQDKMLQSVLDGCFDSADHLESCLRPAAPPAPAPSFEADVRQAEASFSTPADDDHPIPAGGGQWGTPVKSYYYEDDTVVVTVPFDTTPPQPEANPVRVEPPPVQMTFAPVQPTPSGKILGETKFPTDEYAYTGCCWHRHGLTELYLVKRSTGERITFVRQQRDIEDAGHE